MKAANEFTAAAHALNTLAEALKPQEGDQYGDKRKLAAYYLRMAAREVIEVAQALAKLEDAPK